jgi:hypothetical protein
MRMLENIDEVELNSSDLVAVKILESKLCTYTSGTYLA